MTIAIHVFRTLFGVMLLYWTAVGLGAFGWKPPAVSDIARPLRDAIFASGYMIPAVLAVYFVVGVSYVTNRYVALASVILFPVSLNILLFHAFLNRPSVPMALVLFVPNLVMLYLCRDAYAPLLHSQL